MEFKSGVPNVMVVQHNQIQKNTRTCPTQHPNSPIIPHLRTISIILEYDCSFGIDHIKKRKCKLFALLIFISIIILYMYKYSICTVHDVHSAMHTQHIHMLMLLLYVYVFVDVIDNAFTSMYVLYFPLYNPISFPFNSILIVKFL